MTTLAKINLIENASEVKFLLMLHSTRVSSPYCIALTDGIFETGAKIPSVKKTLSEVPSYCVLFFYRL